MTGSPQPVEPVAWLPLLAGQLAGPGLGLGLLWLQSSGDFSEILWPLDPVWLAGLAAWPLAAAALIWFGRRRAAEQPLLPVLIGLAPAVLGFVLAGLSMANLGFVESTAGACPLWLALQFEAERLRLVGLLASGSIWLGCLPIWFAPCTAWSNSRPGWLLPLALGLLVGVGAWSLLDPLLPGSDRIGGPAVRGLWPLVLAGGAVWLWTLGLGARRGSPVAVERGLALGLSAWIGLVCLVAAVWLLHRADGLQRLLRMPGPVVWPDWLGAGLSLSAVGLRLAPLALVFSIASLGLLAPGLSRPGLRRALGLVAALVVLGLLAGAHEAGFSKGFENACARDDSAGPTCALERRVLGACLSAARRPGGDPLADP